MDSGFASAGLLTGEFGGVWHNLTVEDVERMTSCLDKYIFCPRHRCHDADLEERQRAMFHALYFLSSWARALAIYGGGRGSEKVRLFAGGRMLT